MGAFRASFAITSLELELTASCHKYPKQLHRMPTSKPYAEFVLRSPLSEEALRAGFRRECPTLLLAWRLIKSSFSFQLTRLQPAIAFRLKEKANEIILEPIGNTRNSLRGIVHIRFQKDAHSSDTLLNITIAPIDQRILCLLFLSAFILVGVTESIPLFMRHNVPKELLIFLPCFLLIGLLLSFIIIKLAKYTALKELPDIQDKLEQLLQTIENNPPETIESTR